MRRSPTCASWYGATIAIFPIDAMTLDYLRLSNRDAADIELVEARAKAQGPVQRCADVGPGIHRSIEVDLSAIEPSLAGQKRPQDRVPLKSAKRGFATALPGMIPRRAPVAACAVATELKLYSHGDVVIAAITSCTNTSNPSVMIGAGLVAKKAVEKACRASRG